MGKHWQFQPWLHEALDPRLIKYWYYYAPDAYDRGMMQKAISESRWENAAYAMDVVIAYAVFEKDVPKVDATRLPRYDRSLTVIDEKTYHLAVGVLQNGHRHRDSVQIVIEWIRQMRLRTEYVCAELRDAYDLSVLRQLVLKYAGECPYDLTRDQYIHMICRMKVAPFMTALQRFSEPPYEAVSDFYGDLTNKIVRPIVTLVVRDYVRESWDNPARNMDMFCIVCTLIVEMIGHKLVPLLFNQEILAWDAVKFPALCVLYGTPHGTGVGYVSGSGFVVAPTETPCMQAVMAWIHHIDQARAGPLPKLLRQFCDAVLRPHTTTRSNPFLKYLL